MYTCASSSRAWVCRIHPNEQWHGSYRYTYWNFDSTLAVDSRLLLRRPINQCPLIRDRIPTLPGSQHIVLQGNNYRGSELSTRVAETGLLVVYSWMSDQPTPCRDNWTLQITPAISGQYRVDICRNKMESSSGDIVQALQAWRIIRNDLYLRGVLLNFASEALRYGSSRINRRKWMTAELLRRSLGKIVPEPNNYSLCKDGICNTMHSLTKCISCISRYC